MTGIGYPANALARLTAVLKTTLSASRRVRRRHRLALPFLAAAILLTVLVTGGRAGAGAAVGQAGARAVHASAARSTSAPKQLYWGAWIGSQLTGHEAPWDMRAVTRFEALAGKRLSLVEFSSPWLDCSKRPCAPFTFPTTPFQDIRDHGAIPVFDWSSESIPTKAPQTRFQLRKIDNGSYDRYIKSWARAAKAWGHPFFLRFDWEMNGHWFPWAERSNGNHPGDFTRMWRHVHNIFTSVGATNATWVWCPNLGSGSPMARLYPGNAYVDWTCLDGYNWGQPWSSFDQLYRSTYQAVVAVAPTKPMMVGETASVEHGGSKAAWITDLLTVQLTHRYPKIKAFVWFEKYESGQPWPIESSLGSRRAFAHGIASPGYATNRFSNLSGRSIKALP